MYWIAIAMTIVANVVYHLCSKSTAQVHPLVSLTVTYSVSLSLCLLLYFLFARDLNFIGQLKQLNWASFVLGVAIVLLECGFILAYRTGWNLAYASLFSNIAVGLSLLPFALLVFKDRLSSMNVVGIVFAVVGLLLLGLR